MSHTEQLEEAFNNIHDLTRIYNGNLLSMNPSYYAEKAKESLEYLRGYQRTG